MGPLEPWQQWATAAVTFLSGLAAVWATFRMTRRRDQVLNARLGRRDSEQESHDQETALAQCWEFARKREKWYSDDRREMMAQLAQRDRAIEELRKECHTTRNALSEERMARVRLEESLRWVNEDREREKERDRGREADSDPPPPGGD